MEPFFPRILFPVDFSRYNLRKAPIVLTLKGPIHDSDFQPQPRSAIRSRLLLTVYPHTLQPIWSISQLILIKLNLRLLIKLLINLY